MGAEHVGRRVVVVRAIYVGRRLVYVGRRVAVVRPPVKLYFLLLIGNEIEISRDREMGRE